MRYEDYRRREVKWNTIFTLSILFLANLTFLIVSHNNAIAANPKSHLCYWEHSYSSDKVLNNSQTVGNAGYPVITLSKGDTISTENCPVMYLVGSNREWIDPTLANNQFSEGTFTIGKELLPGRYATAVPEEKEISCSNNTYVNPPGSNRYITQLVCAPKNLAYLTKP